MTYESFSRKVLKEIKKRTLDNRVHPRDVFKTPYKKRYELKLCRSSWDSSTPLDYLNITDKNYNIGSSEVNVYEAYLKVKNHEMTKEDAIDSLHKQIEFQIEDMFNYLIKKVDEDKRREEWAEENGVILDRK